MAAFTKQQLDDFSIKNWYDLTGRTAVVTGGASGLGLAITRCLVSAGAKVVVVASRSAEAAAEALDEFGDKVAYYQFNITDTDHAQELADKITAEQGPVSILILSISSGLRSATPSEPLWVAKEPSLLPKLTLNIGIPSIT